MSVPTKENSPSLIGIETKAKAIRHRKNPELSLPGSVCVCVYQQLIDSTKGLKKTCPLLLVSLRRKRMLLDLVPTCFRGPQRESADTG
jgi:hypothetical protein